MSRDEKGRAAWTTKGEVADLVVADAAGQELLRKCLGHNTSDWGYEGCSAEVIGWFGDCVVVRSHERGSTFHWSFDLANGSEKVLATSGPGACVGDTMILQRQEPGLLECFQLPSFEPMPPLVLQAALDRYEYGLKAGEDGRSVSLYSRKKAGEREDRFALPVGEQRTTVGPGNGLFDEIEKRIFRDGRVLPGGRFIVEALVHPFAAFDVAQRPVTAWMPFHWHAYLVALGCRGEAKSFVALLDSIAEPLAPKEPESGWNPLWSAWEGQIQLAVRYVRRQARTLAAACRGGTLPDHWWCLLFYGLKRETADRLPPSAAAVFRYLADCYSECARLLEKALGLLKPPGMEREIRQQIHQLRNGEARALARTLVLFAPTGEFEKSAMAGEFWEHVERARKAGL